MVIITIIVTLYCLALLLIFAFSLGQLHLAWHYLKKKTLRKKAVDNSFQPLVTVQLPIYNEKYVVDRLLEAVTSLEYPAEKLEIQVLDDSTDESIVQVEKLIENYRAQGLDIKHIRRTDRKGFKAGALQYGMEIAKGDFLAIFDADFLPEKDFIKRTISDFSDEKVGVVQTRWGHLNRDYSLLTRLQAFGLDAHFTIEQTGRSAAGSFINFNGTGGVWRKKCIEDAGGWSDDTLTEDLDLSYRAQLKGWKFLYLEDYSAPAELPVIMPAIKSQQYRWNKGAAETARKHLKSIFTSKLRWINKVHAYMHLFNSSIFICLLAAALFSVPMLYIKVEYPQFNLLFNLGSIFLIGFFSIAFFYWVAAKRMFPDNASRYYWKNFPAFLIISMGLSLHNAIAVLSGLLGKKTAFIRTPKFNIKKRGEKWQGNSYVKVKLDMTVVFEGILSIYFLFGIYSAFVVDDLGLIIFHTMLALGFALVFIYSLKSWKNA